MKIQVFGTGCPTCLELFDKVKKVREELKIEDEVSYTSDIMEIANEGIAATPALKINGKVIFAGRAPSIEEIKEKFQFIIESDSSLEVDAHTCDCNCADDCKCGAGNCDCGCDEGNCDCKDNCSCGCQD